MNSFAPNTIAAADADIFTFNPELPAYSLVNLRAGVTRANGRPRLPEHVADTRASSRWIASADYARRGLPHQSATDRGSTYALITDRFL